MLVLLLVVLNGFLVMSRAAPPAEHNSRTFRNALNQQGLQTILQSIEERLRNLDQIYSVRYAPPNVNTDQIIRKIEILENKLSRMETQMELQLEKISENMSSKNFKDDIAKDQLFRKMDSVYERINHKLSYVEGKIDMDILKLQTKIEAGISKIERLDHSFTVRQADMEAEVSDAVEMMESVKDNVANIENKLMNITKNTIENTFNKQTNMIHTKLDNVTNLITQIDMKVNNSLGQCYQKDGLNDFTNKDTQITKTFKGYEDQIQNYGNKVSNMYNELWKKSTTLENTMKHSVLLMNLTRKDIQELKKVGHKFTTYNSQNDGQLEIIVDSFTNTIQRKFAELGRKLESNIENVIQLQNLFLESCHRIQIDESQLENKISLVLEKLLDAVTNRSINTFKEIQSMEELIKSHDTNVYRTLNQNTNTIIKLSEKTSEDRKKLEKILSTIRKDIGNALETIQNEIRSEEQENSQKFDTVAGILLKLQEQVNDLDSRVNEDNINYNAKQILHDILLATNVEDLTNLMTRIYHLLTSIDSKINTDYQQVPQNITNTKDPANITQEITTASDEVTEPAHFVLEILPEKNTTFLGRFNYTLITDQNDGEEINEYISALESSTKKDNGIIINANSNADIPQASTMKDIEKTTETPGVIIKQNNFEAETTKNIKYGIVINGLSTPGTLTKMYMEKNDNIETIDDSDQTKQNNLKKETVGSRIIINGQPVIPTPKTTTEANFIVNELLSKPSDKKEQTENNFGIETNSNEYNGNPVTLAPETATKENIVLSIPSIQTNFEIETNKNDEYSKVNSNIPTLPRPENVTLNEKPNKNEESRTSIENVSASRVDKNAYYAPDAEYNKNATNSKPKYPPSDASAEMKEDIALKGFPSSTQTENKNENNGVIITAHNIVTEPAESIAENFSNVTIADIPVSDITIKSVKIESVTTTELFDDNLEGATAHAMNSFEYTDLKNNTNDEYEWDYED